MGWGKSKFFLGGKSKFFGGQIQFWGGQNFAPPQAKILTTPLAVFIMDFQERKKINCKLYPCINMCSVYLIMICVQLYQCIYVFSEAYTYQKMDCKLCLYDNMCIHILHMYLWLCCSILVYHDM